MGDTVPNVFPEIDQTKWYFMDSQGYACSGGEPVSCECAPANQQSCCRFGTDVQAIFDEDRQCNPEAAICFPGPSRSTERIFYMDGPWDTLELCLAGP